MIYYYIVYHSKALISLFILFLFFFNDTATTEIYTLSLHDALPISDQNRIAAPHRAGLDQHGSDRSLADRKSTRLNSSHANISYAVFCLKKKNQQLLLRCVPHETKVKDAAESRSASPFAPQGLAVSNDLQRVLKLGPHETKVQVFFFFNDTATTEIYTLSLHDAL